MVVATGFFDGVHIGHRHVIDKLVQLAKERGDESMVVTFWPHPRTVLQNGARTLRLLTALEEKKSLLTSMGVDRVEVLPFTKDFSHLSTEEYLSKVLIEKYGARTILIGYDNRMGNSPASPNEIQAIAEGLGLEVERTDSVSAGIGTVISSTQVRNALAEGRVEFAAEMLGYNYMLHGVVVAGNQIGRKIGFPTANMQLYEPLKMLPANGVYLVSLRVLEKEYYGMCNIGTRPTVNQGENICIETNIFGFDEFIYGLDLNLSFLKRIRDEKRFENIEALKSQLEKDREEALDILGKIGQHR